MATMTTAEAAEILGVTQRMVQAWIKKGLLRATWHESMGGYWTVASSDVAKMRKRDTRRGPKKKAE